MNLASLKESLIAMWKICRSFRRRDWELTDYPVVIRKQNISDGEPSAPRSAPHQYVARIVNWWVVTGGGNTPQEAMNTLTLQFNQMKDSKRREGKPMPRPGRKVPIEFAPSSRVGAHPELREEFIQSILGLPWAFVSDESSLWDFHEAETNDVLNVKIKETYGVDVSDIESGNLAAILDRIAAHQSRQSPFSA